MTASSTSVGTSVAIGAGAEAKAEGGVGSATFRLLVLAALLCWR